MRRSTPIGPLILATCASAQVCTVERVSVDAQGVESDAPSTQPAMTPDGRFVVFTSVATNLVPGDTNGVGDVFLRDLYAGTIERVSIGAGGVECDQNCSYPAVSDDGRWVAFNTAATTLDPNDGNAALDVYLRDRWNGTIERVSVGAGGTTGNGPSFGASLAADARYVAFVSWAEDLVPGDTNGVRDVFLRDRVADTIERISVSTSGVEGNDLSGAGNLLSYVTPDGRYVLFGSGASNLVANDTNQEVDAFLRDRWTGTTTLLVHGPGGGVPNGITDLCHATPDARFVAFVSSAPDLVPGDTNGATDAFVLDRSTGLVDRVSLTSTGAESVGESWSPVVSHDGRYALFSSTATDIVPGDLFLRRDLFRHDRLAGTTERFVPGSGIFEPQEDVFFGAFSGAGDRVAVAYAGPDLVPIDLNGFNDIFVSACIDGRAFCSGDGTASACPCGPGVWNGGCPNTAGNGAALEGEGRARVASDTFTLSVRDLPPHTTVLYVQGSLALNGGNGFGFGDGLRCVGGSVYFRLATLYAPDGRSAWGFGVPGAPPLSVQSSVPAGGDTRLYQALYRNALTYCTPATMNSTNGLEVLWQP